MTNYRSLIFYRLPFKLYLSLLLFHPQLNAQTIRPAIKKNLVKEKDHYSNLYSLEDLNVLYTEKNFEEFLAHAFDISPSQRKDSWKKQTQEMAIAKLESLLKRPYLEEKDLISIENLGQYSLLKENEFFGQLKSQLGIKFYKDYLQKNTSELTQQNQILPLAQKIKTWWIHSRSALEEDIAYAQLLTQLSQNAKIPAELSAFSYIKTGLNSEFSTFYCKNDLVQSLVTQYLEKFLRNPASLTPSKILEKNISTDCLQHFKAYYVKELYGRDAEKRRVAFQVLQYIGGLNDLDQDFFDVLFILDGPYNGKIFNHAWNKLKLLGKNYKRRTKVFAKIKSLDPLPDEILNLTQEDRLRAIMNHFTFYFPEYFNFYAETCLAYYEGLKSFDHGNPTFYCLKLFKNDASSKQWIAENHHLRFSKLKENTLFQSYFKQNETQ